MEPRIQYAQTKDGVSIAFWTLGEGMPFVSMPTIPGSHIHLEWRDPRFRHSYERLARKRMLIRYDGRGSGLSDSAVRDYSLDALTLDLQAVVEHLRIGTFDLFAPDNAGLVAIHYAVRHPEQVSHLVLWCAYAQRPSFLRGWEPLSEKWESYLKQMANELLGFPGSRQVDSFVKYMQESVTGEIAQAALAEIRRSNVSHMLDQVKAPTLVLYRREATWPDTESARLLSSEIPHAYLVPLEGSCVIPYWREMDEGFSAIDEFLAPGKPAKPKMPKPAKRKKRKAAASPGVATILFTDMEGSTALTQRLGDVGAREVLREHERIVREALRSHGGSELKTMGDGFMASFSSATRALECAIAMQRALAAHNESAEEPILVRVGMNAGEPIAEEEDLFGTAVIRAARIAAEAKGGEILVSNVVRELAEGKQFRFADRGEVALKGFDEPVRLYEVRWRE